MAFEKPVILSTTRARIIFGLSILLAASAGLGALSSQWDQGDAENQDFPAMRAPMQPQTQPRHDSTPSPGTPSSVDTGKATGAA